MGDDIRDEITKLAKTISQIESNFNDIKRGVQKIEAQKVIRVAGKLKEYSPEWTQLHEEYTALVHESQLSANKVQSKIQYLLDIIKSFGEDHQGLRTYLSTFIKDLQEFQHQATPIESRFLRLRQGVDDFRWKLKDDVAAQVDPINRELEEIDLTIQELQGPFSSTLGPFMQTWRSRQNLKERRKALVQEIDICKNIEAFVLGKEFDHILDDTLHRFSTVQGIWHMLRLDAYTLLYELETSSNVASSEARRIKISRFECLYETLWFALTGYTSEVAKTGQFRVHSKNVSPTPGDGESIRAIGNPQWFSWFALRSFTPNTAKNIRKSGNRDDVPTIKVAGTTAKRESSVRDDIRTEIVKLAETISEIESNFSNTKRLLQKIDAQKVIRVADELRAYSTEWIKLHDEYTALIHESKLGANKVKSKIKNLLGMIERYEQDHDGLGAHLSTYINDLKEFQDEAALIDTRFLRLSQGIKDFKLNLKEDAEEQMDLTSQRKLEEIELKVQELEGLLSSTSRLFTTTWAATQRNLEDRRSEPEGTFVATAVITALAPSTSLKYLLPNSKSLGFSVEEALENRDHRQDLREELRDCLERRKALQTFDPFKHIKVIIWELDDIFEDTLSRLYIVHRVWHAIGIDAHSLQCELESSSSLDARSADARRIKISRFKDLYNTLSFALDNYTLEVAKTNLKYSRYAADDRNAGGKMYSENARNGKLGSSLSLT